MSGQLALIVDVETFSPSGEFKDSHYVTEIGVIVWDVIHDEVISQASHLVKGKKGCGVDMSTFSPRSTVSGISLSHVEAYGWPVMKRREGKDDEIGWEGMTELFPFLEGMPIATLVAHSAQYEKKYIKSPFPWICTVEDIDLLGDPHYPDQGKSLMKLCFRWNIPYVRAHRALRDCQLTLDVIREARKAWGEERFLSEWKRASNPTIELLAPKSFKAGKEFSWSKTQKCWQTKSEGYKAGEAIGQYPLYLQNCEKVRVKVLGHTFSLKDDLNDWGFTWEPKTKIWWKDVKKGAVPLLSQMIGCQLEIME